MYAANYLFRCGEIRWALDPILLSSRTQAESPTNTISDFERVNFIVFSHRHADHLDIPFLKSIASLNVPWVIPDFLIDELLTEVPLPVSRIIVPKPGEVIEIDGIKIHSFNGLHFEYEIDDITGKTPPRGVSSLSYLFEVNDSRWFFPGDIRTYHPKDLQDVGCVDGVVAHVWLGRKKALEEIPPLFLQFCNFFLKFQTRQILLTHLYEWGRPDSDLWTSRHAEQIISNIKHLNKDSKITYAKMGDCIPIK